MKERIEWTPSCTPLAYSTACASQVEWKIHLSWRMTSGEHITQPSTPAPVKQQFDMAGVPSKLGRFLLISLSTVLDEGIYWE